MPETAEKQGFLGFVGDVGSKLTEDFKDTVSSGYGIIGHTVGLRPLQAVKAGGQFTGALFETGKDLGAGVLATGLYPARPLFDPYTKLPPAAKGVATGVATATGGPPAGIAVAVLPPLEQWARKQFEKPLTPVEAPAEAIEEPVEEPPAVRQYVYQPPAPAPAGPSETDALLREILEHMTEAEEPAALRQQPPTEEEWTAEKKSGETIPIGAILPIPQEDDAPYPLGPPPPLYCSCSATSWGMYGFLKARFGDAVPMPIERALWNSGMGLPVGTQVWGPPREYWAGYVSEESLEYVPEHGAWLIVPENGLPPPKERDFGGTSAPPDPRRGWLSYMGEVFPYPVNLPRVVRGGMTAKEWAAQPNTIPFREGERFHRLTTSRAAAGDPRAVSSIGSMIIGAPSVSLDLQVSPGGTADYPVGRDPGGLPGGAPSPGPATVIMQPAASVEQIVPGARTEIAAGRLPTRRESDDQLIGVPVTPLLAEGKNMFLLLGLAVGAWLLFRRGT